MSHIYLPSLTRDTEAEKKRNAKIIELHQQGVDKDGLCQRFGLKKPRVNEIIKQAKVSS